MIPEVGNSVLDTIIKIQTGNSEARENFIREYKPFIAKTSMDICKRLLTWGESDELSLGMIAFNTALDTYDPNKRVPFLPYARVVIQNKLKDFFRKESRLQKECSFNSEPDGKTLSPAEIQSAWKDFQDRTIEEERRDELLAYEKLLGRFGIDFMALVDVSPKHKDSRQNLFEVAAFIAGNSEMMKQLQQKKQLQISDLVTKTNVNRKTLERGRKFIIATALVLHYRMEYPYIHAYINLG